MKEIKFRAWDTELKRMRLDIMEEGSFFSLKRILTDKRFIPLQFTGLICEMEKEIYSGYIVKTPKGIIAEVVYELGKFILVSNKFEDGYEDLCNYHAEDSYCDLEIVGNKFENPSLLGDKK